MSDTLLDNSSRREITSPIPIGWVNSKEPHIVSLGADDESELRLVVGSTNCGSCFSESGQFLPIRQLYLCDSREGMSLLDDMSVLTFGNTISEHDDLVGEFTSSLLEHCVV